MMSSTHQSNERSTDSANGLAPVGQAAVEAEQVDDSPIFEHKPSNLQQGNDNNSNGIVIGIGGELPVPEIVNLDDLEDSSGKRISYEQWLSKEIPRVSRGRTAYIDRETPFEYPHLDLSDAERATFLDDLTAAIDQLYGETTNAGTAAVDSEQSDIIADDDPRASAEGEPSAQSLTSSGRHSAVDAPEVEQLLSHQLDALGTIAAHGLITPAEVSRTRLELIKAALLARQTTN